jgi:hypothetical protein
VCDNADVRDVVDYLFAFFERIKIDLAGRLNPFKEEVR